MNLIPVILTIHALIVLALIGVVLLQRSEGGALGIGGGGGGGFMSGRGAANVLTRTTAILAFMFFATSLTLGIFADQGESEEAIFNAVTGDGLDSQESGEISADDLGGIFGTTPAADPPVDPLSPVSVEAPDAEAPPADDTPADDAPAQEPPEAAEEPDLDPDSEDDPR